MIIDGKLVVSKKKKAVLVSELKAKGFRPFPKVADASKEGETEETLENEDDAAEDTEPGANDYDYLLGVSLILVYDYTLLICIDGNLVAHTGTSRKAPPPDW